MNWYDTNALPIYWMPTEFNYSDSTILSFFMNNSSGTIGLIGLITVFGCILPLMVLFLSYISYIKKGFWSIYVADFFVGFNLYILAINNNYSNPWEIWFAVKQIILVLSLICSFALIIYIMDHYRNNSKSLYITSLICVLILPVAGFICTGFMCKFNFSDIIAIDISTIIILFLLLLVIILFFRIKKSFFTIYWKVLDIKNKKERFISSYYSMTLAFPIAIISVLFLFLFLPCLNSSKIEIFSKIDNEITRYNIMLLPFEKYDNENNIYSNKKPSHTFYKYDIFRQIIEYEEYDGENNKLITYGSSSCNTSEKRCAIVYREKNPSLNVTYFKYGEKKNNKLAECKYNKTQLGIDNINEEKWYIHDTEYEYIDLPYLNPNSPSPVFEHYYDINLNENGSFTSLYWKYTHYHWWEELKTLEEYITFRDDLKYEIIWNANTLYTNYNHISKRYISYKDSDYQEVFTYSDNIDNTLISHEKALKK